MASPQSNIVTTSSDSNKLLPSFDPRPVAPHSYGVIGTVLVATASPQSNIVTTSSDSNKLLPASDPWAVAANPVAFISTPPAVSASSKGHPSTTAPNVELLPASDPWAVAQDPVTFVSTPFAASASPECHSQTIPECSRAPLVLDTTLMLATAFTLVAALVTLGNTLTMRSLATSLMNVAS